MIKIQFIDFEVFKHDWLVVIVDVEKERETVIVNDAEELVRWYEENRRRVTVGYNIRNYDQWILRGIVGGFDPKEINDWIILEGKRGWEFSQTLRNYSFVFFDLYQNIDRGLKFFEGAMGHDIKETGVSFDIDRKLTADEIEEVIKYCRHDVEETMAVFLERKADFDAQMGLLKLFNLPLADLGKTKPQLSAKVLGASRRSYDDEFDIDFPDTLRIEKYTEVVDWYKDPRNHRYEREVVLKSGRKTTEKNTFKIDVAGVPHVFGWGGVHGARDKYSDEGYYINMDVGSLYPALMIEYNLMSRSVPNPAKYTEIRDLRMEYKAARNPLQAPLKIVLNGTYGAMKDVHNALYDPRQANRVCIYGQVLLLDLIERLEEIGAIIIQSNTDGILCKMPKELEGYEWGKDTFFDMVDDVAYEWEQRTRLDLEFDEFSTIHQKDVNNYIMVAPDGTYKSKGAYVKRLSALDYDLAVVNRAIVEYLTKGIDPQETVYACDSLRDFQMIARASSKYKGLLWGGKPLGEKTARVFASTRNSDGGMTKIHKETGKPAKCAGTPENCFMRNGDVSRAKVPEHLARGWYIDLAKHRLRGFGVNL